MTGEEWKRISDRAAAVLHAPEVCEPSISRLIVLRLWHRQSFGLHRAWILSEKRSRYRPYEHHVGVRAVIWDPRSARAAVTDAERHLQVFDRTADATRWIELEEEAAAISIPPFPVSGPVGLDGESFGVDRPNYMRGARLQWWGDGPPEWAPLVSWFGRVIELCDASR